MREQPKQLLQGTLDMLILRILVLGPRHGNGIPVTIQRTSEEDLLIITVRFIQRCSDWSGSA